MAALLTCAAGDVKPSQTLKKYIDGIKKVKKEIIIIIFLLEKILFKSINKKKIIIVKKA
jgi:hypothetical protein